MMLSDRLQAVVTLTEPCAKMADIGCDHGYVAIELVRRGICSEVIAMDVKEGPLEQAKNNIKDYGMQEYITTRLSDGVRALQPGEADGIICAGMGGRLVINILTQGKEIVKKLSQLVLQPQSEIREVRSFLREAGFVIDKEDMVFEDGKYYPMMHVIPGTSKAAAEEERLQRVQDTYGPYLLKQANPVLKQYLLWQQENYEKIRENLRKQKESTKRRRERMEELEKELDDIAFCLCNYFS